MWVFKVGFCMFDMDFSAIFYSGDFVSDFVSWHFEE